MTRAPPRRPLIAIIGATGTGKSQVFQPTVKQQLAVDLAKRYNGEIINGDAMQLYAGLPIITNKITVEEQQGIPHHLLGCIGLREQTWVVSTFVRNALAAIEDIHSRGRVPILVGGTHYYTQSLLFKDLLAEQDEDDEDGQEKREFVENTMEKWPILKAPTEVLLQELRNVDPIMADRWHPNDRRKIQRSLEIFLQSGKKASDIYSAQRSRRADSRDAPTPPEMRFPTLLFWIHAEAEPLRQRLDNRVDKMLQQGLIREVESLDTFAKEQLSLDSPVDDGKGIWVSIGYKEFKDYIRAREEEAVDDRKLEQLKAEALERTKAATRQYSKRQVRWIRIKLVNALAEVNASDKLYLLDGTDVSCFDESVAQPALRLTDQFLRAEDMALPSSLSSIAAEQLQPKRDDLASRPQDWSKNYCAVCDVTCVTPLQWTQHTSSTSHKKRVSKRRQAEGS